MGGEDPSLLPLPPPWPLLEGRRVPGCSSGRCLMTGGPRKARGAAQTPALGLNTALLTTPWRQPGRIGPWLPLLPRSLPQAPRAVLAWPLPPPPGQSPVQPQAGINGSSGVWWPAPQPGPGRFPFRASPGRAATPTFRRPQGSSGTDPSCGSPRWLQPRSGPGAASSASRPHPPAAALGPGSGGRKRSVRSQSCFGHSREQG